MMETESQEKCIFYQISRDQRKTETDRGLSHDGTMGYEKVGCYNCDGFRTDCERKIPTKILGEYLK